MKDDIIEKWTKTRPKKIMNERKYQLGEIQMF